MSVAASLVVTFGDGADSSDLVVMEFDKIMNVDAVSEEKTQFAPGDEVFFLIHHASTLRIGSVKATAGMVVSQGRVTRAREQQLLWTAVDEEQELSCIPSSALTAVWYGNEATGFKKSGFRAVTISGGVLPALSLVSYSAVFAMYKIITPFVELAEGESWPITIVAEMEAVA